MSQLYQVLDKKDKRELINIIENFIERYPELKSLIKIEKMEITAKIKKLFSCFWEWNQVDDLVFQLNIILDGIKENKKSWNRDLLNELEISANIMIKNFDNVHGEDEIAIFLEDWFEIMGEILISTKPAINEKEEFIRKIFQLIEKDNYGLDTTFEKALFIICRTKTDLEMIKGILNLSESKYPKNKEHYERLYNELKRQMK